MLANLAMTACQYLSEVTFVMLRLPKQEMSERKWKCITCEIGLVNEQSLKALSPTAHCNFKASDCLNRVRVPEIFH